MVVYKNSYAFSSACLAVDDCMLNCRADESEHCLDNFCMCRKDH